MTTTESIHKWSARQRGREPVQMMRLGADSLEPLRSGEQPSLGAVIVSADAIVHTEAYVEVARAWHQHPWCPVLLLGNQPPSLEDVSLIRPVGMRLHVLACGFMPSITELRAAVHPAVPTVEELAGYVAVRRGPDARWAILRALEDPTQTKDLRNQGLLPPGDWRAIFTAVDCVAHGVTNGLTEAATAERAGIQLGTLSRHCRRHFGKTWPELRRLVHWEAVLEASLRRKELIPLEEG